MKAKLAGIASHTGMSGVFRLRGAICTRGPCRPGRGTASAAPGGGLSRLSALRRCAQRVAGSNDLDSLVEHTLDGLVHEFGIRHAMLLMLDAAGSACTR